MYVISEIFPLFIWDQDFLDWRYEQTSFEQTLTNVF